MGYLLFGGDGFADHAGSAAVGSNGYGDANKCFPCVDGSVAGFWLNSGDLGALPLPQPGRECNGFGDTRQRTCAANGGPEEYMGVLLNGDISSAEADSCAGG